MKCDLLSDRVPISASLVNCFNSNNDTFQPIQKVQFEKKKIKWKSYDKNIICSYYTEPLSVELLDIDCNSGIDKLYYSLLRSVWSVSEANLDVKRVSSVRSQKFRKIKHVYSPVVEKARSELNSISAGRKKNDSDELRKTFVKKRCEYRKIVRSELKLERDTRITDLCSALEVDEKSFSN